VLLHGFAAIRSRLDGETVQAVHVDHGLSHHAQQWSAHCQKICADLGIPTRTVKVNARPQAGESPEAAARAARYQAFATLLEPGDCLVTAHHQDDQAETLLLQLLRGSGPHGLAGMPACAPFSHAWLIRPLLDFTRDQLHIYAEQENLNWIQDPSNFDTGFDRNFLRHEVMPLLKQRWPSAAKTLARSAGHCAEAAQLTDELAHMDLDKIHRDTTNTPPSHALPVSALRHFEPIRAKNALRAWIGDLGFDLPSAVKLNQILVEVLPAPADAEPCVRWPGCEIRRYRDRLYALAPLTGHDSKQRIPWNLNEPLTLSGIGILQASTATGTGLAPEGCRTNKVSVGFRRGGERCRPVGRAGTHTLKKLLQEFGVPPWQRDRVPLIFIDGQLAVIVGYCYCEPFAATPGQPGICIDLVPG
jgi:tRNA(Ile)-lysidine synthase